MRMTDRHGLRPRAVHGRMQQHADGVHRGVAVSQPAGVVHLHDVGHTYSIERDPERIGPEAIRVFQVSHREVSKQPFRITEAAEDTARPREALDTVTALVLRSREYGLCTCPEPDGARRNICHGSSPPDWGPRWVPLLLLIPRARARGEYAERAGTSTPPASQSIGDRAGVEVTGDPAPVRRWSFRSRGSGVPPGRSTAPQADLRGARPSASHACHRRSATTPTARRSAAAPALLPGSFVKAWACRPTVASALHRDRRPCGSTGSAPGSSCSSPGGSPRPCRRCPPSRFP